MTVSDAVTKFVDRDGLNYAIDKLKEEMNNISAGDVDLSDYVTETELQEKLDALDIHVDLSSYATTEDMAQAISEAVDAINISSYATKDEIPSLEGYATESYVDEAVSHVGGGGEGTPGKDGADGFSPVITENEGNTDDVYKLDITTKTAKITTPNLIGRPGKDGVDGEKGEKGEAGPKGDAGPAGENGKDGFSPAITENSGNDARTYKLDITDATHTFTTPNLKGADGASGSGGGGEGASTYIYPEPGQEITVGQWIDGRTIYRQTYQKQMDYSSGDYQNFTLVEDFTGNRMIDYLAVFWYFSEYNGGYDYSQYVFHGDGFRSFDLWTTFAGTSKELAGQMTQNLFQIYSESKGNKLMCAAGSNFNGSSNDKQKRILYAVIDYVKESEKV